MKPAELVVCALVEDDIDWTPDPEDADFPANPAAYIDKAHPTLLAVNTEGFERAPDNCWYKRIKLDSTGLRDGSVPYIIEIAADLRAYGSANELSVVLAFAVYGNNDCAVAHERTLLNLSQLKSGTDEEFSPVVRSVCHAARTAAQTVKNEELASLQRYMSQLTRLLLTGVPTSYIDGSKGFAHYNGRIG